MPHAYWSWQCNECGSDEFSSGVSEYDISDDKLSCTNCGCTEFHKVPTSLADDLQAEANRLSLRALIIPGKKYSWEEASSLSRIASDLVRKKRKR